jgi:hypothetical protein
MSGKTAEVQAPRPVLVYLYGPPAAGKLTIGERVSELTGFRLFHNHLTVNAIREVFDFGTAPFTELVHRVRLDVFATAMRAGISLIFTNNSAWGGPNGHERFQSFAEEAAQVVEVAGGITMFVRVTAPLEVLENRLDTDSRRAHGKLLDVVRLRELVSGLDEPQVRATDFVVDTVALSVEEGARAVAIAAQSAGTGSRSG